MLAGVLINICLIPVTSLVEAPSVIGGCFGLVPGEFGFESLGGAGCGSGGFDGHGGGRRLAELANSSPCSGVDLANHFLK